MNRYENPIARLTRGVSYLWTLATIRLWRSAEAMHNWLAVVLLQFSNHANLHGQPTSNMLSDAWFFSRFRLKWRLQSPWDLAFSMMGIALAADRWAMCSLNPGLASVLSSANASTSAWIASSSKRGGRDSDHALWLVTDPCWNIGLLFSWGACFLLASLLVPLLLLLTITSSSSV